MARFHRLRVAEAQPLCDDAAALTFDVPKELAAQYAFRPGQSLTVRHTADGRDERRSYSVCSPAGTPPRIGVREVPGGLVSTWLVRQVRPGDEIDVAPPTGSFTPDLTRAGHHVLIGAGSGITPLLSIAASVLARSGRRVTVLYGNRRSNTVMFADELADLKDAYPSRLELVHVLSREPHLAELFTGRLDAARLRVLLPALVTVGHVDQWWLCGPYAMVADAVRVLTELDVSDARVHQELFYVEDSPRDPIQPAEPRPDGPTSHVTVILDGRSTTLAVQRDSTILESGQRARPDLPFACKGGVCGTCRAQVVEGTVHMRRNFALEPGEIAAGFVLTCQSTPVSETITVNYDA
jgi:ring-1,2-phenylacetyl-CoA epoxidase subunit PaaE